MTLSRNYDAFPKLPGASARLGVRPFCIYLIAIGELTSTADLIYSGIITLKDYLRDLNDLQEVFIKLLIKITKQ